MTDNQKALTFPRVLRRELEAKRDEIMAALPSRLDPDRFIMVALTAVVKNPKLQECSLPSIFLSIMESAWVGLMPDHREAALIPYAGRAEFMPMARGIVRLMLRSPGLTKVEARPVYEGDEFEYGYGLRPRLVHHPAPPGTTNRPLTHAYAIMWRQGAEPTFEVLTRDEIERARLTSRAPDSPAWRHWYGEMARKVALKRLAKYADLSPEATRAIELDHMVGGGDPLGPDYVDGPSEDYRNLVLKIRTKARLAELARSMAREAVSDESPEAEATVSREEKEAKPKKKPAAKKTAPKKPKDDLKSQYWHAVFTDAGLDQTTGEAILKECGNDLEKALEVVMKRHVPPEK
jgi:phage RecT family recombinase